jgi:hypothetical protein
MSSSANQIVPPTAAAIKQFLKKYWFFSLATAISMLAAVVIFLFAFPYSWWKVPNEFDETPFQGASVYKGQEAVLVYKEKIIPLAIRNIEAEDPDRFDGFSQLLQSAGDKVLVWENFVLKDVSEIGTQTDRKIQQLQANVNALSAGDYYANYSQIEALNRKIQQLGRFHDWVQRADYKVSSEYELVALKLSSVGRAEPDMQTVQPLTDLNLLGSQTLPENVRSRLEAIAERQRDSLLQSRSKAEEEYKETVLNPRRKEVREVFLMMWCRMLIFFAGTVVATWLLTIFFSKIRRTGIKRKSTEDHYFATNKSQKIFQWIALIIVFLTYLLLWGQFLLALLFTLIGSAMLETVMPAFFEAWIFDYLFVFLMPNFFVLLAVVYSWFFLLASEFIWFLSNCYHLIHLQTYDEKEPRP